MGLKKKLYVVGNNNYGELGFENEGHKYFTQFKELKDVYLG
jgi:hypothetical protein